MNKLKLEIGMDVTELLGIVKYDPPLPAELAGVAKGFFPSFIPKTDEERIQNLADKYGELKEGNLYYATEKLDGTSTTFFINNGEFGVCTRNLELLETDGNTIWRLARELKLEEKFREYGGNFALQGECIGEGIQGNPYKLKGQTIKFFNVFDIDTHTYFDLSMFKKFMEEQGLETVPLFFLNFELPKTIEEIIVLANGPSLLNPLTNREGLVIRSIDREISFKVISNTYLLNNEK